MIVFVELDYFIKKMFKGLFTFWNNLKFPGYGGKGTIQFNKGITRGGRFWLNKLSIK